jgi:hypothetical protein
MKYTRDIAIVLLVFLAMTAFMGSLPMIMYPRGDPGLLPLSTLSGSPFHSFLIPGILLLTANGVLAFAIAWLVSRRKAHSGQWTAFQGYMLLVWVVSECCLLHTVISLHYFYAGVAALLIASGLIMRHQENQRHLDHKG